MASVVVGLVRAYRDAFKDRKVAFASPAIAAVGGLVIFYGLGFIFALSKKPAHGTEILIGVVLAVLSMIVGVAIGWKLGGPDEPAANSDGSSTGRPPADSTDAWTVNRWLPALGMGLTGIGLAALVLYLIRIGSVPILMSSVEQGRVEASNRGGAALRVLAELSILGAWFLTAAAAARSSIRLRLGVAAAVAIVALMHLATANRANAFLTVEVAVVIALLVAGYRRLSMRILGALVGITAVLVLAAGFVGGYRLAHSPETWNDPDVKAAAASHDYVRLTELALRLYLIVPVQNTNYTMEVVPDRLSWRLGLTYIQPVLTILPGRQTTFDQDIKDKLGQTYAGGGTVPSILGEAWANFGPLGWILVPLLLGGILTWLYRRALAMNDPAVWTLYAYLIVAVVNANLSGLSVANIFPIMGTTILVLAVVVPRVFRRLAPATR